MANDFFDATVLQVGSVLAKSSHLNDISNAVETAFDLVDTATGAHTITSHIDTTATGAELEALTNASNADALHVHTAAGVTDFDTEVGNHTDVTANTSSRHDEAHSIASHNDSTATGVELELLTDGSNSDSLHVHTATGVTDFDTEVGNNTTVAANTAARHDESHTVISHSDTTATGAELEALTDDSMADTLHRHSELSASDGSPNPALSVDGTGLVSLGAGAGINEFSTDETLSGDSDSAVPTEQAVKAYVDNATSGIEAVNMTGLATKTLDCAAVKIFELSNFTVNTEISFSNFNIGNTVMLIFDNADAITSLTFSDVIIWPDGTSPTYTSDVDTIILTKGTSTILGAGSLGLV